MRHVRLRMTADGREAEIHPMYDVMANAPFVTRAKTTHWNYSGQRLGIMHYVEGDQRAFREAIEDVTAVRDYELTTVDDGTFYAYLQSVTATEAVQDLFGALTAGSLVVHFPIRWNEDGSSMVSVVGSSEEIQAAIDGMPEPVSVDIQEIGGLEQTPEAVKGLLTDRQREAVAEALASGYYEIPRRASLEDVADSIGCARSTAAEHLRKSERKLLESVFGEGETLSRRQ